MEEKNTTEIEELKENIRKLEVEIEGYKVDLRDILDREERIEIRRNITAARNNLNIQLERLQKLTGSASTTIHTEIGEPWLVLFSILPKWKESMTPEQTCYGVEFPTKPTYDQLRLKCLELFGLDEVDLFSRYKMFGVYNGLQYELSETHFAILRGVQVKLVPRYYTYEFNIITFKISYSRKQVITFCKAHSVAGSVTRDSTISLRISLHHPELTYLDEIIDTNLKPWLSGYDGKIDEEYKSHFINYGTLNPVVQTHTGTAKRNDGVDSWEDEDAKSGSTYFNAPIPSKKDSKGGQGSMFNRMYKEG